jgi:glycosyltransferase involved in cell wall biosynthesis
VKNLLFADIAVTTSEHTKRELLARGISNVRCVYPGVPLPGKIAGAEEKLQAKQKLGFGDAPVVLFGGDYETSEAIETLVRAIPRVLSKSKAMFVLACRLKTGNALLKKKQVENTLRKSGILSHVKFLDPVPSMEELYSASDIQLMHQEHYYAKIDIPLVLLEGFSFGIPAVMARGTPPEELMRFADAGIVVPPTDSEALAEAILNLISDREKYQKISDACRNLINERFNISIMTNSYIEIYKELLKI